MKKITKKHFFEVLTSQENTCLGMSGMQNCTVERALQVVTEKIKNYAPYMQIEYSKMTEKNTYLQRPHDGARLYKHDITAIYEHNGYYIDVNESIDNLKQKNITVTVWSTV